MSLAALERELWPRKPVHFSMHQTLRTTIRNFVTLTENSNKDDTSKPEQRFKAWAKNLCTRQALCQALGYENFTSVLQYQGENFSFFKKKC